MTRNGRWTSSTEAASEGDLWYDPVGFASGSFVGLFKKPVKEAVEYAAREGIEMLTGSIVRRASSFGPKSLGAAQASIKLTGKAKKIMRNLQGLKDVTVREAIRMRGGGAGVVNEAGDEFAGQFVGHVANAAARGNKRAATVIKLIKDAKRLGQKY